VRLVTGSAEFLSKSLVEVNSETERHLINFKNCVITIGQDQLVKPSIKGLEEVDFLYKDSCFLFEHIPSQIGLIGLSEETLEIASLYADLGIKVDIVDKHKDLSAAFDGVDKSIINYLLKKLFDKQVDLHFNFDTKEVKQNKKGDITLKNEEGKTKTFAQIYLPLKESFSGKNLAISKIGIKATKHGIATDVFGRTNHGHIYALGECSNKSNRNSKPFMIQEYLSPQSKKVDLGKLISQKSLGLDSEFFYVLAQNPIFGIGLSEDKATHVHGSSAKKEVVRSPYGDGFAKIVYRDVTGKMLGAALTGDVCQKARIYLTDAFQKGRNYQEVVSQIQVLLNLT
jgi:pyruvate/2-oxoglutarate dehydrogenase complex dihydrolipoamide dehydrogenase (E3) component